VSDLVDTFLELSPGRAAALLRDTLKAFGAVQLRVTGNSMIPAILAGEVVRVADAAERPPRFGDVVLVALPEGLRLHRLVWVRRSRLRTKGDSTHVFDRPHSPDDALGTVVGVEREGRGLVPVTSRTRAIRSLLSGLVVRLDQALRADSR
jgi:hypothetical protein